MAAITEDYVSFEIAKLLKEKGFPQEYDIYHSMVYNEEDYEDECEVQRMVLETKLVKAGTLFLYPVGVPEPKCYCPTLQMVMKWLREEHNVYVQIEYERHAGYNKYGYTSTLIFTDDLSQTYVTWKPSYEEAAESAIKYYLENPT